MIKGGIFILMFILLILPVYSVSISYEGTDFELKEDNSIFLEVDMQSYILDVDKIYDDYAELVINHQIIKLSEYNPIRRVDADNDGYYDFIILLNRLSKDKVYLTIRKTTERDLGWVAFEDMPEIVEIEEKEIEVEEEGKFDVNKYIDKALAAVIEVPYIGFIILGLIILSILIILMEYIFSRRKKAKKSRKKKAKKKSFFEKIINFLLEEED